MKNCKCRNFRLNDFNFVYVIRVVNKKLTFKNKIQLILIWTG